MNFLFRLLFITHSVFINPNILTMVVETLQVWDDANGEQMVADIGYSRQSVTTSPRNHLGELRRVNFCFDPWRSLTTFGKTIFGWVICHSCTWILHLDYLQRDLIVYHICDMHVDPYTLIWFDTMLILTCGTCFLIYGRWSWGRWPNQTGLSPVTKYEVSTENDETMNNHSRITPIS